MHADFLSRHDALLAALAAQRDPQQRLAWVIDRARQAPPFPSEGRTPEHLVPGCAARLWLRCWTEATSGTVVCRFAADSDSAILKAFAVVLCNLYDGLQAAEIIAAEPRFLHRSGLLAQLTENRQRTVLRVHAVIRDFANSGIHPSEAPCDTTARPPQ